MFASFAMLRNPCAVSRPTPQAPLALGDREGSSLRASSLKCLCICIVCCMQRLFVTFCSTYAFAILTVLIQEV